MLIGCSDRSCAAGPARIQLPRGVVAADPEWDGQRAVWQQKTRCLRHSAQGKRGGARFRDFLRHLAPISHKCPGNGFSGKAENGVEQMSHALHTDANSAEHRLAAYGDPLSQEPMSWRAAAFVVFALSAAGWLGVALGLKQLIG